MSVRIINGDARAMLKTLPDASVHCVVTSPPYFGLRSYLPDGHPDKALEIGLEETPAGFVGVMVDVFREVRRVLRDDGTVWLNLGDSYAGSWGAQGHRVTSSDDRSWHGSQIHNHPKRASKTGSIRQSGLKPKDLMMIPARVAIALQDDGWWLRSDIIWAKRNCMPESITDRPSSAHEHIFLLAKRPSYFYDAQAIREIGSENSHGGAPSNAGPKYQQQRHDGGVLGLAGSTRNSRNVWTIATKPFSEAHFATFPPELAERCIKAGTSERGCCSGCGSPWERVVEKRLIKTPKGCNRGVIDQRDHAADRQDAGSNRQKDGHIPGWARDDITLGWRPSCTCPSANSIPCTVLDPFAGAFTAPMVADRLQRDAIGIELNADYCAMANRRLIADAPLLADVS